MGTVDPQLLAGTAFGGLYVPTAPYGDVSVRMSSKAESGIDPPIVVDTQAAPMVTYTSSTSFEDIEVIWDLTGVATGSSFELSIVVAGTDPAVFSTVDFVADANAASSMASCGPQFGRTTVAPGETALVGVSCSVIVTQARRVLPLDATVESFAFEWTPGVTDLGKHVLGLVHLSAPLDPLVASFGVAIDVELASDDDCVAHPGICDPHASCKFTPDGFRCECDQNYTGDGRTCQFVPYCFIDMRDDCFCNGYPGGANCCFDANMVLTCSCPSCPSGGGGGGQGSGGDNTPSSGGGGCGVATQAGWLVALFLVLVRFRRPRRGLHRVAIGREAKSRETDGALV